MRILINDFCGHGSPIELSRELARRGHGVLHLYFADNLSTPKGETEYTEGDTKNFVIEGLHVPIKFDKHSIRSRRAADLAYGKAVSARAVSFRPDVILSGNMPLDAQKILQQTAKKINSRFVFWLQDVYSSAVRFVLKRKLGPFASLAAAYYERLERQLLTQSDCVVCISPAFARIAESWGVEPSRNFMVENWGALREIQPMNKENRWSREHGVDRRFCFMYSGTLGMKHRPELLLNLGKFLSSHSSAKLIVNAAGIGADWLLENAQMVSKDALELLPFQPYSMLPEVLGASDVLIALLDSDAAEFAVPSKILAYLCAGRPLIIAAPKKNHAAAVVEKAEAGVVVSPDSPDEIVDAAKVLMENAELRARYAANALAYAARSFKISDIADRFIDIFSGGVWRTSDLLLHVDTK